MTASATYIRKARGCAASYISHPVLPVMISLNLLAEKVLVRFLERKDGQGCGGCQGCQASDTEGSHLAYQTLEETLWESWVLFFVFLRSSRSTLTSRGDGRKRKAPFSDLFLQPSWVRSGQERNLQESIAERMMGVVTWVLDFLSPVLKTVVAG